MQVQGSKVQRPVSAHGEFISQKSVSSLVALFKMLRQMSWSTKFPAPVKLSKLIAHCDGGCLVLRTLTCNNKIVSRKNLKVVTTSFSGHSLEKYGSLCEMRGLIIYHDH